MNNATLDSIHLKLLNSPLYYEIKEYLKTKLFESKNSSIDVSEILKSNEFKFKLKNQIFNINAQLNNTLSQTDNSTNMPLYIVDAENKFLKIMKERLTIIKQQYGKPLVSLRSKEKLTNDFIITDLRELFDKEKFRNEIKNISYDQFYDKAKELTIFSIDKFLYILSTLKSDNVNYNMNLDWCKFKVLNFTPSIEQIKAHYKEMISSYKQYGFDEDQKFMDERYDHAQKLADREYVPYLKKFARRGIPPALRKKYYKLCLNVGNDTQTKMKVLKELVRKYELICDDFLLVELEEVTGDGNYFLFEDIIRTIYFCFTRDTEIASRMKFKPLEIKIQQDSTDPKTRFYYPFCGAQYYRKLCNVIAVFSYLSESEHECYYIFREFYCKYMSGLFSFTLKKEGIIYLCRLTENLIQEKCPQVYHLLLNMNIYPTDIMFDWYLHMFAGYLCNKELFILWDRIIGYDSNEVMALLGASLFYYRSPLIYECKTQSEVKDLFLELTTIQVMPVILNFFAN